MNVQTTSLTESNENNFYQAFNPRKCQNSQQIYICESQQNSISKHIN